MNISNWNLFSNSSTEQKFNPMINQQPLELKNSLNTTLGMFVKREESVNSSAPDEVNVKTAKEDIAIDQLYKSTNGGRFVIGEDEEDRDDYDDVDDDRSNDNDEESLPSPDNMYSDEYNSPINDSNCINNNDAQANEDIAERLSGSNNSKDDGTSNEVSMDDPLAQLQKTFGFEKRPAMLGLNLGNFNTPNGTSPNFFGGSLNFTQSSIGSLTSPGVFDADQNITRELYKCHLCSYTGSSKFHFEQHMNTHFDHKCPFCDYTSRTEGRLKRHIRDFHSQVPPENWAGTRILKSANGEGSNSSDGPGTNGNSSNGKSRKYKCKQCEFIATCKQEFWEHSKSHIKPEKVLTCPKCNFVTEYKHHLEYHLRNHFGSKPFKCAKCNYSCVNKSMLNSHMKSHSNIYQYRCRDCNYATKYCHSLKLHLRKYNHMPSVVLNLDGTPNPYPVIDVYGTRRGPRPKKNKQSDENNQKKSNVDKQSTQSVQSPVMSTAISPMVSSPSVMPPIMPTSLPLGLPLFFPTNPALMHRELGPFLSHQPLIPSQISSTALTPFSQSFYDSQAIIKSTSPSPIAPKSFLDKFPTSPAPNILRQSPSGNSVDSPSNSIHEEQENEFDLSMKKSPESPQTKLPTEHVKQLKCNFCNFTTENREIFGRHLLLHAAALNQDICKVYGINANNNPEVLQQKALLEELQELRRSPLPLDLSSNKNSAQESMTQSLQLSRAQKRKGKAFKLNVNEYN